MKFSEDISQEGFAIRGYAPGQVTVSGPFGEGAGGAELTLGESFIIAPQQLIRGWPPVQVGDLLPEHFEAIVGMHPEVVIIGVGATLRFPDPAVLSTLMGNGIGYEVMDTAAACRTYNILMGEGRQVAAAILML